MQVKPQQEKNKKGKKKRVNWQFEDFIDLLHVSSLHSCLEIEQYQEMSHAN